MPKGWMQDSAKLENGEGNLSEGVAYELIGIPDSPTGLLIRLDEEWLKSPERVFPVRVDPSVDVETPSDDTFVQESIQNTRQDSNTELKAGCGQTTDCTPGSGTNDVLARTLLHFNLPGEVSGNQVTLAELKIYEFHSWSCSAEWVHVVDVTSGWTGAVTWPGQPSYGGELATLLAAKGYSGSCPAGWLNFIDSRLTAEVDGWSRYGQPNNGLSVQSFNEASELGWKKFRSYQYGSNRPTMHIDYNRQPTAPTLSGVNDNDTLRTFTPTLSASSTDPDGNPLQYQFHIMLNGADVHVSPWTSNNYVVPMGILRDGGRYNWYAVAKDTGPWESAPSSTRGFKLDVLRLGVRSYYPTDSHSLGNGTAASINLASGNLIVEQTDVNLPTASAPFSFVRTYNSKASGKGVQVYLDDDDGRPFPTNWEAGEDGWVWVTDKFWSGSKSHKSPLGVAGLHQHYFYGGQEKTFIPKGSSLVTYIWLDPNDGAAPLGEVMLQFREDNGNWDHRGYWGSDLIPTGGGARTLMSAALPPKGQWVRLEIPASAVGLENKVIDGVAYSLWGGAAWWDKTMVGGGFLGHGWSFGTELGLDLLNFVRLRDRDAEADVIELTDRQGGTHFYYDAGGGSYVNEQGDSATLKVAQAGDKCTSSTQWQLTTQNKVVYCFEKNSNPDTNGTLDRVIVPQQPGLPGLDYFFVNGKLDEILDATGTRKIKLVYGGPGQFAGTKLDALDLYVKNSSGSWPGTATRRVVTYTMTIGTCAPVSADCTSNGGRKDGLLTQVEDASAHKTVYTYDEATADLLDLTTPRGVVTTGDANDFKTVFGFPNPPLAGEAWKRIKSVTRKRKVGATPESTTEYTYDLAADSQGNKKATVTEPKGVITNPPTNDYQTTYKYNTKDNPIEVTDPAGKVSKLSWYDNLKTGEIDRTGRRSDFTFDKEGRPLLSVRPVVDPASGRSIKPIVGPGETGANGWRASYYNTTALEPLVVRQDSTVDFDWAAGSPDVAVPVDNFTARWIGYINVTTTDEYTFTTTADDEVTLWVNGTRLIAATCCGTNSGKISFPAVGWYPVVLEYREATSWANVRLYWSALPSVPYQIIPSSSVRPGWAVSESHYDAAGNNIRTFDGERRVTKNNYDGDNRLTSTVDPAGNTTTLKYYSASHPVGDPCRSLINWMAGLLCTKTMPGGGVTTYKYFDGELYSETGNSALQNVRQTGFLKAVVEPVLPTIACHEQVTSCSHYDWLGNKIHSRNAKGDTYLALNSDNQVIKAQFPPEPPQSGFSGTDGSTFTGNPTFSDPTKYIAYSYDEDGNRTTIRDPAVTGDLTEDRCDDLNRPEWSKDSYGGQTTYAYDANSFLTQSVSPAGTKTFTPSTDGLDRVAALNDTQNKTFSFNYDDEGRLTRSSYPNTTHVDYSYGGQGELISQHNARVTNHAAGEALISANSYSYDPSGKKTSEANPVGRTSYVYDPAARLEGVVDASGPTDSYFYDANSNRTKMIKGETTLAYSSGAWQDLGGTWRLSSNYLKQTDTAVRDKLMFAQDFPQDVTVEVKIKFPSASPAGVSGLILKQNSNSSGTYYAVRLDQRDNTVAYVVDNTAYSAALGFSIVPGTWYTLKAVMSGSTLNVYVDGALKITRSDLPTTVSNYLGVKTSLTETHFDDFKVWVGSQTGVVAAQETFSGNPGLGTWGFQEGSIAQLSTDQNQLSFASDPISPLISSYTISSRIKIPYDPPARKHAGLVVDWDQALTKGYRIAHLDSSWEIYRFDNAGSYQLIGGPWPDQGTSPASGWQSVKVVRDRTSGLIELSVNSKVIGSAYSSNFTPNYTTGGVGFFSWGSKGLFRDTRITRLGTTSNYTYNSADQLKIGPAGEYCYDGAGSLESVRTPTNTCGVNESSETRTTFDRRERLKSVLTLSGATVTYSRDGLDRVVKRNEGSEVRLRYESAADAVAFETDSANVINRKMTVGPPGLLVDYKTTALTPSYAYFNGHGDLVNTADGTGATTATYRQDPFGVQITSSETVPDNSVLKNRYLGKWQREFDATTGFILMGARPYDPVLGRFLSRDPVEGGSANDYDYANQDCVNQYDLDGRASMVVIAVVVTPLAVYGYRCGKAALALWTFTQKMRKWHERHVGRSIDKGRLPMSWDEVRQKLIKESGYVYDVDYKCMKLLKGVVKKGVGV